MSVAEVLRNGRARISTPTMWWKWPESCDVESGQTCAVFALEDQANASYSDVARAVDALARSIDPDTTDPWRTVTEFNDAEGTTHADVLAAYDRAIEASS